jgi:hypothetical protein
LASNHSRNIAIRRRGHAVSSRCQEFNCLATCLL